MSLFLSSSESTGNHPELFAPLNRKWKLYVAVHSVASQRAVMASGLSWAASTGSKPAEEAEKKPKDADLAELARRVLLQSYAPASVVADNQGNILYVHGETGKYLRPAPGKATLNLVEMAREGLQLELRAALQGAASLGAATLGRCVSVKTNGDFQMIGLSVRPLTESEDAQGLLLVSFQDLPPEAGGQASAGKVPARRKRAAGSEDARRVEELERTLAYTRENLQATIEEQQASNEELKSTNEEMQSTNEELQSTNEELETSKEELQSVNEELITVNAELQAKIEQLAGMQNDMKNLLDNINVGTIFLDQRLIIRRFTRDATRLYRLVATDVGRPLADIKAHLEDDDLLSNAQTVLDTLAPWEREVRTDSGTSFLAHIQPYRTLDNVIEGVVLTFTDISTRVAAEMAVQGARELAEAIVDTVREPLVVLDGALRVVSASRAFYHVFQIAREEALRCPIYELGDGRWNKPALRELLEKVLPHNQAFEDYAVEQEVPGCGRYKMLLNGRRIVGDCGDTRLILLAMEAVVAEDTPPGADEDAALRA